MRANELLVIAPDEDLYKLIDSLRTYVNTDFTLEMGLYEEAVKRVHACSQAPRMIISRGETSLLLQQHFQNIPILDIPILSSDILELLAEARNYGRRIAMIGFGPVYRIGKSIAPLIASDTELFLQQIRSPDDIALAVYELMGKEYTIVGHKKVAEEAQRCGMTGLSFHSRPETVLDVFREAEKMLFIMHRTDKEQTLSEALIDIMGQKMFFLDEDGMLVSPRDNLSREADLILHSSKVRNAVLAREPFIGLVRQGGKTVYCRTRPLSVAGNNQGTVVLIEHQSFPSHGGLKKEKHASLRYSFEDIIHQSEAMKQVIHMAQSVADSDAPVLLSGDLGTGKEVLAQSIHRASFRRDGPFVKVNCASLSPEKLEITLMGNAEKKREGAEGLVEQAKGGTLFLDKIGSLSLAAQMTLLRLLEDPAFYPYDVNNPFSADIRLIVSSDVDLIDMMKEQRFEKALFFRIGVLHIRVPRLADRKEDIHLIAQSFLNGFCFRYGTENLLLSGECLDMLKDYDFPGNIRELQNLMERLVVARMGRETYPALVPEGALIPLMDIPVQGTEDAKPEPGGDSLVDMERQHIARALGWAGGNKARAARMLGIAPSTLWRKCKKLGIAVGKGPLEEGGA